MARYEDDHGMRQVAFSALMSGVPWFGDLKMDDSDDVITQFLLDWRAAQLRHDTGGRSIWRWAAVWAETNRDKYEKEFPYLAA